MSFLLNVKMLLSFIKLIEFLFIHWNSIQLQLMHEGGKDYFKFILRLNDW